MESDDEIEQANFNIDLGPEAEFLLFDEDDILMATMEIDENVNHDNGINNKQRMNSPVTCVSNGPITISKSDTDNSNIQEVQVPPNRTNLTTNNDQNYDNKARFKKMTENDLTGLGKFNRSESTKRNTRWGVKMFQDWCSETDGKLVNFEQISKEELNEKLRHFYGETRPQNIQKRAENLPPAIANEYHKNTLKNIRAALNRHLCDIGRNMDIVRDVEFKPCNKILNSKLKQMLQTGLSRPTKHKDIIETADLKLISTYLTKNSPVHLRLRVWFMIAIHFVTRGLEFHHQLKKDSFRFCKDDEGHEYVTLNHGTLEKNKQGGIGSDEAELDKRMYASGDENCPLLALKTFISKTDPSATSLFNKCNKDALLSPDHETVWYTNQPLAKRTFVNFMSDISKNAKCSKIYTAHCLRATSIQALNDAGFELRHIMFMTGHKNEASVRSYNRQCSSNQKRSLSATLSKSVVHTSATNVIATSSDTSMSDDIRAQSQLESTDIEINQSATTVHSNSMNMPAQTSSTSHNSINTNNPLASMVDSSLISNIMKSTGILNNCKFENCSFNFSLTLPNFETSSINNTKRGDLNVRVDKLSHFTQLTSTINRQC